MEEIMTVLPSTVASENPGINLNKDVKDLYDEDFKSLKTETGTKKWKDKPCSWIGNINIVEIIILTRNFKDSIKSPLRIFFLPK